MRLTCLPPKFAEDRYGLEPTAANIAHLSRAISNGEGELFTLPKGKSGKVKLYKGPSSTTKEVGWSFVCLPIRWSLTRIRTRNLLPPGRPPRLLQRNRPRLARSLRRPRRRW